MQAQACEHAHTHAHLTQLPKGVCVCARARWASPDAMADADALFQQTSFVDELTSRPSCVEILLSPVTVHRRRHA